MTFDKRLWSRIYRCQGSRVRKLGTIFFQSAEFCTQVSLLTCISWRIKRFRCCMEITSLATEWRPFYNLGLRWKNRLRAWVGEIGDQLKFRMLFAILVPLYLGAQDRPTFVCLLAPTGCLLWRPWALLPIWLHLQHSSPDLWEAAATSNPRDGICVFCAYSFFPHSHA